MRARNLKLFLLFCFYPFLVKLLTFLCFAFVSFISVHTVDSSAQTEDWSDDLYAYDNPAAMYDNSKENETAVTTATDGKARLVS